MASWTAVRVLERGRFWVWVVRERLERLGRGRMRREATIRTWRSENFFSSSRVRLRAGLVFEGQGWRAVCEVAYRCWTLCQPWRRGTGTKMTIAFLPWPTSIYKSPGVSIVLLPSAHRLFDLCSCRYLLSGHSSTISGGCVRFGGRAGTRVCAGSSYLAGGHELERTQRRLHVRDVLLEVVESIGNAGLDLGGALPRGAVGSDLVQGGRHGCGLMFDGRSGREEERGRRASQLKFCALSNSRGRLCR